ncbi:mitotic checkpoint regulator, MAD2B-interacting-domain-containing protein [Phakopsora pachyrhizi]|nr:mitotic checkpoint regulator, MAD2B-interacting-domain-containing protein [Phakopsora pachyrhizi]
MGLVDYCSGSESEGEEDVEGVVDGRVEVDEKQQLDRSTSTSTNRNVPQRKTRRPTKARIILDLPPPSVTLGRLDEPLKRKLDDGDRSEAYSFRESQESSSLSKKLKLLPFEGQKRSGLAGILPPPKQIVSETKSDLSLSKLRTLAVSKTKPQVEPSRTETELVNLAKKTSDSSRIIDNELLPTSDRSENNGASLFGFPLKSSHQSSNQSLSGSNSAKLTISSAPTVTEEAPPPPSVMDPYPGYWQRSNGVWVHYGDSSSTQSHNTSTNGRSGTIPKDFFERGGDSGKYSEIEEFNAAKVARDAWENKPKIIDPREEARKEQAEAAAAAGKASKQISARARGRHQLTSLLTEAQANRAELEDRISRGKFNRKAGGAKYALITLSTPVLGF